MFQEMAVVGDGAWGNKDVENPCGSFCLARLLIK